MGSKRSGPRDDLDEGARLRARIAELEERLAKSEQARRLSEAKFEVLLRHSPILFTISRRSDGLFLEVSEASAQVVGLPRAELIGKTSIEGGRWADPSDRQRVIALLAERGVVRQMEVKLRRADGVVRDCLMSLAPLDIDGTPCILAMTTDIHELRRAEEESRRLAAALEQAGEAIIITDREGVIQYVNPAFERLTGWPKAEALGKNPRILKSGRHGPTFYHRLWQTLTAGASWTGRIVNRRKDGTFFEQETTVSPVRDAAGALVSFVCVGHDVTDRAQLEAQLQQAQKLESIGLLAGGVAHDFNNLLTPILGYADLSLMELAPSSALQGPLRSIKYAAERAAGLTQQLLAFSRTQILDVQVTDLNAAVASFAKMARRVIEETIDLSTVLDPGLGTVKADHAQLEQILMNLTINARDAMPDGGRLTLETSNFTVDEAFARAHQGLQPGHYAMISVVDTGHGMTPEVKARLFEPFFSTKEPGHSSGLGLSTVYGLVRQHGGAVLVESAPGRGSTFSVLLPWSHEPPAPTFEGLGRGAKPRRETILVVEDEAVVLRLACDILGANGYGIVSATDGVDALDAAARHDGPIHLLFTDVVMPRMNGKELYDRLSSSRPGIKVLYTSGFTNDTIARHGVLEPGTNLLPKPFSVQALLEKIRSVLQS